MESLELKIQKEDVIDFYKNTTPELIKKGYELNFYANSIVSPRIHSEFVGMDEELQKLNNLPDLETLEKYRDDTKVLNQHFISEYITFKDIIGWVTLGKEVNEKAVELYNLYNKIVDTANKIKSAYEEDKNKHQEVKNLIDSVKEWITAREQMYNPATRGAYMVKFTPKNF